eukprot:COSAG03_NODE_4188_length_1646_cov_225.933420_2_plen_253_part_00
MHHMEQLSVLLNGALAIAAVVCIRQHAESARELQHVDKQLTTATTPEPEIILTEPALAPAPAPESEPEPEPELTSEAAPLEGPQFCEAAVAPAEFSSSAQPQARWPFPLYELPPDVLGAVLGHLQDTCLARCARVSRAMLRVQIDADRLLWQPRVTKLLQSPDMGNDPPGGVGLWRMVMSIVPREFAAGRVEMVPVRRGTFLAGEALEERTVDYTYWMDVYLLRMPTYKYYIQMYLCTHATMVLCTHNIYNM